MDLAEKKAPERAGFRSAFVENKCYEGPSRLVDIEKLHLPLSLMLMGSDKVSSTNIATSHSPQHTPLMPPSQ